MKNSETLAAVYIYIYMVNSNRQVNRYINRKELCVLTMFNMHSSLPP